MPRKSKATLRSQLLSSPGSRADLVVELIERGHLPMFLRMALSDALYEASLLKNIRTFKYPGDPNNPEHDVAGIAELLSKSVDLFRVLHPSVTPHNEPEIDEVERLRAFNAAARRQCETGVIDLSLWRQSHARRIKNCAVEVQW